MIPDEILAVNLQKVASPLKPSVVFEGAASVASIGDDPQQDVKARSE